MSEGVQSTGNSSRISLWSEFSANLIKDIKLKAKTKILEDLLEGIIKNLTDKSDEKFVDELSDSRIAGWKEIQWDEVEYYYREKIKKTYGWTRVLGKPDKISLEGIFTDVYVIDKPRAFQHYDISNLSEDMDLVHPHENRINGLELVKGNTDNKLFILGKPGAGKTTFLKYIAYQTAQGELGKTPIFISLKEWSDSNLQLMQFINHQFDVCKFPNKDEQSFIEYILEKGMAIVLFDGLDEVNLEGGKRSQINKEITTFCRQFEKNQVLITCRIAASEYVFEDFSYLELADFTPHQVEQYVNKWFIDQPRKRVDFHAELLKSENDRIRQLAYTPILLTLFCLTFDNIHQFPSRKVEIYEEALEALLKKWDSSREIKRDEIYKGLSPKRKHQMLARIAEKTFRNNEYFIPQKKLSRYIAEYLVILPNSDELDIDGEAVLKSIEAQHGIFTERARNIYSFSHLTFQEYFTSKYIIDNQAKELKSLLKTKHIISSKWREVILNTASLLDNAEEFFDIFQHYTKHMIKDEVKIWEFINWVEAKSVKIESELDLYKIRGFYFSLGAELFSAKNKVLTTVTKSVEKYKNKKHSELVTLLKADVKNNSPKKQIISSLKRNFIDYETGLSITIPSKNEDLWLDTYLWLYWTYTKIIISLQELFSYIEFNTIFEHEIAEIHYTLPSVIEKIQNHNENILALELLQLLEFPLMNNTVEEWKILSKLLFNILTEQRNINVGWNFSGKHQSILKDYDYAIELLKSCLDLAVVQNRKFIENRLYTTLG